MATGERCRFCAKPLPEAPSSHVIHAEGLLHRRGPQNRAIPLYAVCLSCLKRLRLHPKELRKST